MGCSRNTMAKNVYNHYKSNNNYCLINWFKYQLWVVWIRTKREQNDELFA